MTEMQTVEHELRLWNLAYMYQNAQDHATALLCIDAFIAEMCSQQWADAGTHKGRRYY